MRRWRTLVRVLNADRFLVFLPGFTEKPVEVPSDMRPGFPLTDGMRLHARITWTDACKVGFYDWEPK